MKKYSVWAEGYAATGETGKAHLIGTTMANSFEQACEILHDPETMGEFYKDPLRYWGCRLFDNRKDAERSYG